MDHYREKWTELQRSANKAIDNFIQKRSEEERAAQQQQEPLRTSPAGSQAEDEVENQEYEYDYAKNLDSLCQQHYPLERIFLLKSQDKDRRLRSYLYQNV